jgi:hypothetical protein
VIHYDSTVAFRPKFAPERLVATAVEARVIDRAYVADHLGALNAGDFLAAMAGTGMDAAIGSLIDFLRDELSARSRERMLSVEPATVAPFEPISIAHERPLEKRFADLAAGSPAAQGGELL